MGYWTEQARPIVARVLAETAGQDESAIRKALARAYPFGAARGVFPRRAWAEEVRRQRRLKRLAAIDERQQRMELD